jgi:hypothetical protein
MALYLVPVLIHAAKVVCAPVDIQHDAVAQVGVLLARLIVGLHLDPLGLERTLWLAPLPPLLAADLADAVRAELLDQEVGCLQKVLLRNLDMIDPYPLGVRHPLAREGLQFLDGVVRGMVQKRADEMKPLVIGQMCGWLVGELFLVEILSPVSLISAGDLTVCRWYWSYM